MKILGYARVSTNGQAENGTSLQAQRAAIEHWCQHYGYTLIEVVEEPGVSGANELDDRP